MGYKIEVEFIGEEGPILCETKYYSYGMHFQLPKGTIKIYIKLFEPLE